MSKKTEQAVVPDQEVSMRDIELELRRLDPALVKGTKSYMAASCLLAAMHVGSRAESISTFTGYPKRFVREISGRLHDADVWKNGKTRCDWFDKKTGIISFWLDVATALGFVSRVKRHYNSNNAKPTKKASKL